MTSPPDTLPQDLACASPMPRPDPAPEELTDTPNAPTDAQPKANLQPKARRASRSLRDALQEGIARDAHVHGHNSQEGNSQAPAAAQVLAGANQERPLQAAKPAQDAEDEQSGSFKNTSTPPVSAPLEVAPSPLGEPLPAPLPVPLGVSDPRQAAQAGSMEWIDVDVIEDNPYQPRLSMDEAELRSLIASISQRGQLQPCMARPHPEHRGRFQLVVGHRRKEAVRRGASAGYGRPDAARRGGQLMCVVRDLDDEAMLDAAFAENEERSDFSVFDRAHYFKHKQRMASEKLNPGSRKLLSFEALAQREKFAISPRMIRHIVDALELPTPVQEELARTDLNAPQAGEQPEESEAPRAQRPNEKHCRALLMLQGPASPDSATSRSATPEQEALLRAIKAERLSGNEALRRAEAFRHRREKAQPDTKKAQQDTQEAHTQAHGAQQGTSSGASKGRLPSSGLPPHPHPTVVLPIGTPSALAKGSNGRDGLSLLQVGSGSLEEEPEGAIEANAAQTLALVRQAVTLARQALEEAPQDIAPTLDPEDSLIQDIDALWEAAQQLRARVIRVP